MTAPVAQRGELAPSTAAGWARLRARLESDGALAAREKALLIAAGAAARGREQLLASELARLSDLGGAEMIVSCASILTLARGRAVAERFAAAAGIALDWSSELPTALDEDDVERARAYFVAGAAAPPPPIALLEEHAPEVLVGYRGLRSGIYDEGTLEPRLVELALFAIGLVDYLPGHAAVHAAKALETGANESELVEAGLCAIPVAGMAAWLFAATVIDELKTKGTQ